MCTAVAMEKNFDSAVSARDVRGRARSGQPFEHLVPPEVIPAIRHALER